MVRYAAEGLLNNPRRTAVMQDREKGCSNMPHFTTGMPRFSPEAMSSSADNYLRWNGSLCGLELFQSRGMLHDNPSRLSSIELSIVLHGEALITSWARYLLGRPRAQAICSRRNELLPGVDCHPSRRILAENQPNAADGLEAADDRHVMRGETR